VGSTSPALQRKVLRVLERIGEPPVLLHGKALLASGTLVSDLDILVRSDPVGVVEMLAEKLAGEGSRLIFVWASDVGTLNTFWWDDVQQAGCQVDMLWDLRGGNRFGVRTGGFWELQQREGEIRVLTAEAESIYTAAKRLAKGQPAEYRVALRELDVVKISPRLLAPRVRWMLRLKPSPLVIWAFGSFTLVRSRLFRLGDRLRRPQGVVVDGFAEDSADGLAAVLPRVEFVRDVTWRSRIRARFLPTVIIRVAGSGPSRSPAELLSELSGVAQRQLASLR